MTAGKARSGFAEFEPYLYTVQAWLDSYKTWIRDLVKKADAGQQIALDILTGAELASSAATRARTSDAQSLIELSAELKKLACADRESALKCVRSDALAQMNAAY